MYTFLTLYAYFSGYIEELLYKTQELCESEVSEPQQYLPNVPKPLSSSYKHPQKAKAIKEHKSRFKSSSSFM